MIRPVSALVATQRSYSVDNDFDGAQEQPQILRLWSWWLIALKEWSTVSGLYKRSLLMVTRSAAETLRRRCDSIS